MRLSSALNRLLTYEQSLYRQYKQYVNLTAKQDVKDYFEQVLVEEEKRLKQLKKLTDKYCPT